MIRAVLFDYGGVMTSGGGGHELTDRLGALLGISGDEAYQYLGPYWHLYDTGKISEDEIWTGIEKAAGKQIATTDRNIWNTWEHMQPIPEMVRLVEDLKRKAIPVGLVSNVIPYTKREIRSHGGYDIFDFVVLSDEIGYAKPSSEIYMYALNKLGDIPAEEVVFVDDQERFLVPAEEIGMKTILATNTDQIIEDIKRMLVS